MHGLVEADGDDGKHRYFVDCVRVEEPSHRARAAPRSAGDTTVWITKTGIASR